MEDLTLITIIAIAGGLIAGGLVAAAGATLVILQAASTPSDSERRMTLLPVPFRGGGGLTFTVELP